MAVEAIDLTTTSPVLIAIASVVAALITAGATAYVSIKNAQAKILKDDQQFQVQLRNEIRAERDEWRDKAESRLCQLEKLRTEMIALQRRIFEMELKVGAKS